MSLPALSLVGSADAEARLGASSVHEGLTIHEAALAILRAQFAAMRANEAGARDGDVESLHDMRVAVRRMRAAMAAFSEALPARAQKLRSSLGWLGSALGEVRDHDVHLERLSVQAATLPQDQQQALAFVDGAIAELRDGARTQMLRALDSQRRARLEVTLEDMLARGPMPRAALARLPLVDVAPDIVARRYRKVRSLGDSLSPHAPADTLHTLRIKAKRLRYVVEFVSPVYGKPARSFAKRVVRIQDLLGLHQDAIVSGAMLTGLVESYAPDPIASFAIGRLVERHEHEADDARSQFPDAYEDITGKRWRALQKAMDSKRTQPVGEVAG